MPELEPTGGPRPDGHPKLRVSNPEQRDHFDDRLLGLHYYLHAGFPTSFVFWPRPNNTKLVGWLVEGAEYNRREAEARDARKKAQGDPTGPWVWHPRSGLHRRRT